MNEIVDMQNRGSDPNLMEIAFVITCESIILSRVYVGNAGSAILAQNETRTCLAKLKRLFLSLASQEEEVFTRRRKSPCHLDFMNR